MINLVMALGCEAQPIIEHYRLQKDAGFKGLKIYARDDVRLAVTGIGKIRAAAGTGFLAAYKPGDTAAWLNVGSAGHKDLGVGDGVHALKITDAAASRSWYPTQAFEMPGLGVEIFTVDHVVTDHGTFKEDGVFEMESSAFYQTAIRCSTAELVQSYKIISDNSESPVAEISEDTVRSGVAEHLPQLDYIIGNLRRLREQLAESGVDEQTYTNVTGRWRFTVSQQNQLRELLRRWGVLIPDDNPNLIGCASARDVLRVLKNELEHRWTGF